MEELDKRTKLTIMVAIMASMLFAALNQTIVGTALPRIVSELGGMEHYSWVFTIYMLTAAVSGLLVGKLSDMHGRKPYILAGLLLFMIGAFLTGTSQNIYQMIIYRGVQGLGGGFIMSTAFTAVGDLFSPRERGKWQGLMGATFGLASVIGPILGGYIVDHFDWSWVFWVNLPIGVLAFLLIWRLFPHIGKKAKQPIDWLGAFFVSAVLVTLLLAFSWAGSQYDWDSPQILGLFGGSLVSLLLFIWAENRAESPIMPLSLFRNSIFVVSNIVGLLVGVAMFGAIMYIPLFVQGVIGTSATKSGLVTMPMMLSLVACSAIAGQVTSRTGRYKLVALLGSAVICLGMFMLSLMGEDATNMQATINMIVVGAGLGFSMPVFLLAVQNATPHNLIGVSSASVQLFRQVGGTVGVSIMGTIMATQMKDYATTHMTAPVKQMLAMPGFAENSDQLMNPQLLIAQDKIQEIVSQLPDQVKPVFQELLDILQSAMAVGLDHVFKLGFFIAIGALVFTLFLKEIPLRTSNTQQDAKEKDNGNAPSPAKG
ncbi:MAG TPA: MDR family MFS transporter [Bacilli bacterium]|nr:MDR family MFS transporter [Bacilli bacterium]